jgi:hypothetical protein
MRAYYDELHYIAATAENVISFADSAGKYTEKFLKTIAEDARLMASVYLLGATDVASVEAEIDALNKDLADFNEDVKIRYGFVEVKDEDVCSCSARDLLNWGHSKSCGRKAPIDLR